MDVSVITIRAQAHHLHKIKDTLSTMLGEKILQEIRFEFSPATISSNERLRLLTITTRDPMTKKKTTQLMLMAFNLVGNGYPRQVHFYRHSHGQPVLIPRLGC